MSKSKVTKDPSESLPNKPKRVRPTKAERERRRATRKETPAKPGMPGSVNDSRRCSATANRTGERCKAPAMLGQQTCRVHGGAAPHNKKAAKERLLELLDPALAELHRVLADKEADDAVKVRAALGILDRTGHGPGAKITLEDTKFDLMIADLVQGGAVKLDRSLPDAERAALPRGGGGGHTWENQQQHAEDFRAEAWREFDAEDAEAYESARIDPGPNVVRGEVVEPATPPERPVGGP